MPERKFDITVLGATGYTGELVSRYLAKNYPTGKWALAGRNKAKLTTLLASLRAGDKDALPQVKIATCTLKPSDASLKHVVSDCTVLINCVGPYRFTGTTVISACIAAKTHYVDVTGETAFIRGAIAQYHAPAKQDTLYIVLSCGWDCVPADMGCMYLQKKFGPERCLRIEGYYNTGGQLLPYLSRGTYVSLIESLANMSQDAKLKSKDKAKLAAEFPAPPASTQTAVTASMAPLASSSGYMRALGRYTMPFSTADPWVVKTAREMSRSLAVARPEAPPHAQDAYASPPLFRYTHNVVLGNLYDALMTFLGLFLIFVLSKTALTRAFLKSLKQSRGPSAEARKQSKGEHILIGFGLGKSTPAPKPGKIKPDRAVSAVFRAPNPYDATAIMVVEAAQTILGREEAPLRVAGGGAGPPSTLLGEAYLNRLTRAPGLSIIDRSDGVPGDVLAQLKSRLKSHAS